MKLASICICLFFFCAFTSVKSENDINIEKISSLVWRKLKPDFIKLTSALVKSWPCPLSIDIEPCTCSANSKLELEVECSGVQSEEELRRIFLGDWPKIEIKEFRMIQDPTEPGGVHDLPAGIFSDKSFEIVRINGVGLQIIEEGVFSSSHDTLRELYLNDNSITKFPFESISSYRNLETLDLDHNSVPELPELTSNSLKKLTINKNYGIKISDIAFYKLPNIEYISLEGDEIKEIQPNLFSMQSKLKTLKLGSNLLTGLDENAINPRGAIIALQLEHNQLVDITHDGIKGLNANNGTIDFSFNQIKHIDEFNWKKLFTTIKNEESINLSGNDLTCGDDVCWIIKNADYLKLVHKETLCFDGTPIHSLPTGFCS